MTKFTPNWLQGMVLPTICLWLYVIAYVISFTLASLKGVRHTGTDLAAVFALPVVIFSWVSTDARKRGRQLCYDYDNFIFFLWPVMLPVYLFETRGWKALWTLLCAGGLYVFCAISVAALTYILHKAL